jgi:DNA relaxase NicK
LPISLSEYTIQAIDFLFKDYLSCALNFQQDNPYFCGRNFSHGHRNHDSSCVLGYNWFADSPTRGEAIITISGSLLARLSMERCHDFLKTLYELGAHCTRFDIAVDDFTKSYFDYEKLDSALAAGNFKGARPKSYSCTRDGDGGWKATVGKRGNNIYRRFYNKAVQSKGAIDAYRYEVEYLNGHAKSIFESFCTLNHEAILDFCSQLLGGAVDFIDRSQSDRASRSPRLDWWDDFVSVLGGAIQWSVPRLVRTIEKTIKWVDKQVASSLAVIRECKGLDWFEKWLHKSIYLGERRFKSVHLNRIENYVLESISPFSPVPRPTA